MRWDVLRGLDVVVTVSPTLTSKLFCKIYRAWWKADVGVADVSQKNRKVF
jgi:hypothetical protein